MHGQQNIKICNGMATSKDC